MIDDFDFIYPEKKDSLFEHFPIHKEKILNLGRQTSNALKDATLKTIINEYLDLTLGKIKY